MGVEKCGIQVVGFGWARGWDGSAHPSKTMLQNHTWIKAMEMGVRVASHCDSKIRDGQGNLRIAVLYVLSQSRLAAQYLINLPPNQAL